MPKTMTAHPKYKQIGELVFARGSPFAFICSLDSEMPELWHLDSMKFLTHRAIRLIRWYFMRSRGTCPVREICAE